jgi:light-harvesting protein B-800-850 alpha chain
MNQGRIWCVVNPTVGLPLFLGSVAVTSLIVHYTVLSNTTWFGAYWNGHAKAKVASVEGAGPAVAVDSSTGAPGFAISITPVAGKSGTESSFVITLAPKAATVAQADTASGGTAGTGEVLALASTGTK